jgi:hypothetical protein
MMKCKNCGHLKQTSKDAVCDINREPDEFNCCPKFFNGYINRVLTGE